MIEITPQMREIATKFGDQVAANLEYDFVGNRRGVSETDKQAMKKLVESGYKLGVIAGIQFVLNDPNGYAFRQAIVENAFEKAD